MNNEFDFKGYLKNNPLLKETNINININESKLRERVKAEILSALKENDVNEGTWALGTVQDLQNFIDVIEQVKDDFHGLVGDDEIYNGLDAAINRAEELKEEAEKKQMFKNVNKGLGLEEAEEKDQPEEEETPEVADVEPEITGDEKIVQDALTKAYETASKMGDKKLLDQIGNTITFFTRTHIVSNK